MFFWTLIGSRQIGLIIEPRLEFTRGLLKPQYLGLKIYPCSASIEIMKFNVISIFPELIMDYANGSILGRAQDNGLIVLRCVNPRDFTGDKHRTVDDTTYGGGPGMLMKPEPVYKALKSVDAIPFRKADGLSKIKKIFNGQIKRKKRTVLLSPRGRQFDQRLAEEWSHLDELTLVSGRYEGVDQRISDHMVDEEISIGPYVLAGGELGVLVIVEAVARLIPDVLGNAESLQEETHAPVANLPKKEGLEINNHKLQIFTEYPQYTKPADFKGWKVPGVLLSGDHKKIDEWRKGMSGERG